jgi:uncharacterized membrane protein YphA (DoxX/SURF4 family)
MLNPFPEILFLDPLAPFILRTAVGIIFLLIGYSHLTKERREGIASDLRLKWGATGTFFIWVIGIAEILSGLSLILGLLTQIGALVGGIISIKLLWLRKTYTKIAPHSSAFYTLLFIVCLSLLFTGAGAFAFDLPL